jgi:CheY-like chemotaxis protein
LEAHLRESQKMEAIGVLAGGIAHDFNNVLAGILGNAAMALQDVGDQHSAAEKLQQIQRAGSRGRHLVKQILAFARRQPTELVPCHLQVRVADTLSLLRAVLPTGLKIQTALTDTPLWISADSIQIDQVVMNLCTNAWHALKDGVGSVVVGLDAVTLDDHDPCSIGQRLPAGRYADLWVRDTGCGMSEATLARIFEPFFTTKARGQGTGLGLAVVLGIVSAHRGAITVQSELGHGTTFHVRVPLIEMGVFTPDDVDARTNPCGQGEHVMYVDDDEVMALMIERLLQRQGYRVTCYIDAHEAIDSLRANPQTFDAVVTDFNMPTMSGLDLTRAMASIRDDLPVVISSGNIPDSLRAEARESGVRAVLDKTTTFETLGFTLQRVLSESGRDVG